MTLGAAASSISCPGAGVRALHAGAHALERLAQYDDAEVGDVRQGLVTLGMALLFGAALTACSDSGNAVLQPSGTGQVSIALTDAPADSIVAAVVTITDIYLQPGTDSVTTANRVYLRQNVNTTVDLLMLRDSLASLTQNSTVPAGTYQQLRFVITGGYIQVRNADGSTSIFATPGYAGVPNGAQVNGELRMPSFAQSGLKVNLPGGGLDVTSGSTTSLVADFNVAQSFGHQAGASGMWVMTPVVNAVSASTTASLTVNVGLGTGVTLPTGVLLSNFQAQLTDASGNTHTLALNGNGSATFANLIPANGPFSLTLIAPAGVTMKTSTPPLPITGLTLTSGTNTQVITLSSF